MAMKRAASCARKVAGKAKFLRAMMPLARILQQQRSSCRSSSKVCRPGAEDAVSCRVLGAAFVLLCSCAQGSVAALRYHCPAQQRDKGNWHTRAIRSIVKQNERPRCRPHTPNGRRRTAASPKITGEAALGLAGAEHSRPEHHSHRARPASTVSSSRFGEGEAACLPESGGFPLRRSRTLAQSSNAQKHDDTLGEVCGGRLVFPPFVPVQTYPAPSCSEFPSPPGAPPPRTCTRLPCVRHL